MTELQRAMSDFVDEVTAGAASRTEELRVRLREIQARNIRYFLLPILMLAVTFVIAIVLIVHYAAATAAAAAISSGFGISVIGMIRLMLSFWREKVATELVIELSELDDRVFRKVVATLLVRMR
jgi:hypothetical protein